MAGVNKVIILGHLGKDPEIRSFQNGGVIADFSVATSEKWQDKRTGEQHEKTEWHKISVTSKHLCTIVEKYLEKGSQVYVEGKLETKKWTDKNGVDRFTTQITVDPYRGVIQLLGSRKGDTSDSEYNADASDAHTAARTTEAVTGGGASGLDDEIPF